MDRLPVSDAVDRLVAYMSGEVAKVPSLRDRFLMFAALGAVKNSPSSLVNAYGPMLRSVGIIDEEGYVNVPSLQAALDMAFANVPQLKVMGFTFTREDAEEVLRRMVA